MAFVTLGLDLQSLLMAIEHLSSRLPWVVVVAFAAFFYFNREMLSCRFKPFQFATFNATLYIVLAFQELYLDYPLLSNYIQLAWGQKQPQWRNLYVPRGSDGGRSFSLIWSLV